MSVDIMSTWYKDCLKAPYFYYGYPGSYIDFKEKTEYYGATIIVHPLRPELCYISEKQVSEILSDELSNNPVEGAESLQLFLHIMLIYFFFYKFSVPSISKFSK